MRKTLLIGLLLTLALICCSTDEPSKEDPRDPAMGETSSPIEKAGVWQRPPPDQAADLSDQHWSAPPLDQNVNPSESFQSPKLRDRAPRDLWLEPPPE